MAEMTPERAETILARARSWHSFGDMTDVQLARRMETLKRDGGFTMAFASLTFMKYGLHRDWSSTVTFGFFAGMVGFAIYMITDSSRFSKIRQLFEEAGPQHLADLKSTSSDKP